MSKQTKNTSDEKLTVFVPVLNRSLDVIDQDDLEKQVAEALAAQKEGDGNS